MNIKEINLNLLGHFYTLLTELSVTNAAKKTKVTQPAMSHVLSELRDLFEDPLMNRGDKGYEPTVRSLILAKELFPLLQKLDSTVGSKEGFKPEKEKRTFVIGSNDYISLILLPRLISVLSKEAPEIKLKIVPSSEYEIEDLATDKIDFLLGSTKNLENPYHEISLFKDDYVCVARKGHPIFKTKGTKNDFINQKFVVITSRDKGAVVTLALFEKLGKKIKAPLIMPYYQIQPYIISDTDLIFITRERAAKKFLTLAECKTFPPPSKIPAVESKLLWHDRSHNDPACEWFRNKVSEIAREVGAG